jgi:hypothetical protein
MAKLLDALKNLNKAHVERVNTAQNIADKQLKVIEAAKQVSKEIKNGGV